MKDFFVILLIAAVAYFVWSVKDDREASAQYRAQMSLESDRDMRIVTNCENEVRKQADKATLSFGGPLGVSFNTQQTDAGFVYSVQASDSTTPNTLNITCYTDKTGNVLRMVY